MIRKTSISTLVELLVQHFNDTHTLESVLALLRDTPVDPESMTPYLGYSEQHYTRNLVHRNEQFEMMVLCWDRGTISAIHNHCDQHCWMTAPIGKLEVQNFKTVDGDPRGGYCKLAQTDAYVMSPGVPGSVDPAQPIHSVGNPARFGERAASIHVYSLPYDSCVIYNVATHEAMEIPLVFDTEYGVKVVQ